MAGKLTKVVDQLCVSEGFQAGRHYPPMRGYWAAFGRLWDDDTTMIPAGLGAWQTAGHGDTLDEAAEEALAIYNGEKMESTRSPYEFGAVE
jgi:hypothetical protein